MIYKLRLIALRFFVSSQFTLVSFHDFRNDDHVVALSRGVLQRCFDRQARLCNVISPDIINRECVRGRLDAAYVDLSQLLDVREDVAELGGKLRLFLGRQREPREVGDMVDV